MDKRQENGLLLIFAVSLIAMLGSLFYSEVQKFIPCTLCWYQRILMYPIVLITGIAIFQKNAQSALTTAAFSLIGACISLYHYGIQKLSFLRDSAPVCGTGSCTAEYVNYLGFITIPFMALVAFILIFITSLIIMKQPKGEN